MHLQPLTPQARAYLRDTRHLSENIIAWAELGLAVMWGHEWLVTPVYDISGKGDTLFHKLKKVPWNKATAKGRVHPAGREASLYPLRVLDSTPLREEKRLVICEGELDCLLLLDNGIPAVTGSAGATTFQEEWLDDIPMEMEIVLCFDNDDAGAKGREKLRALIREKREDLKISDVIFKGEDLKTGYDVTDFYEDNKDNFRGEFIKRITPFKEILDGERGYLRPIATVKPPTEDLDFAGWKKEIETQFIDLWAATEVCMSIVCQLLIHDVKNPFALILIDEPASGKTICLNFFDGIKEVTYSSDNFTPAALVSNSASKKTKDLAKIDMLPRIRFKTLIVREMAPIFGERDEDLRQKLAILTRVLDGEGYETDTGAHGKRGYQGDYLFMMLGASTPIPLRVWKQMGTFGHRLYFLGMGTKKKNADQLEVLLKQRNHKEKEVHCKRATHRLLQSLWTKNPLGVEWNPEKDDPAILKWIARLAEFLSVFRGEVIVFERSKSNEGENLEHTRPVIEHPTRIVRCLYNLACGHAVSQGRNYINDRDLGVVLRVVLDTAPTPRPELLRVLITNGELDTPTLQSIVHVSAPKARKEMEKLVQLGLCKDAGDGGRPVDQDDRDDSFSVYSSNQFKTAKRVVFADKFKWMHHEKFVKVLQQFQILPDDTN
tara:strand:- start:2260 stop:4242 length:1983 start_codon:yes stop_codon:yes gene_type:complete